MAREGRWGRGRAVRSGGDEGTGVVQRPAEEAAPPSATPDEGSSWRAREQRAARRREARAAVAEPSAGPAPEATAGPAAQAAAQAPTEPAVEDAPTSSAQAPAGTAVGPRAAAAAPAAAGRTTTAPDPAAPEATRVAEPEPADGSADRPFRVRDLTPFLLVRAAHPRQALVTAVGMTVAAALAGRPSRELLLVLGTVLVGQVVLGWFNDLVDRRRDTRHRRTGKPLADGRLDPGTLWFCLALAVFLVVPLAVGNGLYAGIAYLSSLAIGLAGQWVWLRKGFFSWVPWAAAFALYPAFLSYGGWGGQERGAPPELLVTGLAALLGIGVHFLTALWGLVPDNEDGWTYLPLKLGLKIGASRLLWVSATYTVLVLVALAFAGTYVGLAQEPL